MKKECNRNPEGYNQKLHKYQELRFFLLSLLEDLKGHTEQPKVKLMLGGKKANCFLTFLSLSVAAILSCGCFLNVSPLQAMQNESMENPSPISKYISISRSHLVEHKDEKQEILPTNDRYGNFITNNQIQHISNNFENYAHRVLIQREGINKEEENEDGASKFLDDMNTYKVTFLPTPSSYLSISEVSRKLMSNGKTMKISAINVMPQLMIGSEPHQLRILMPQLFSMLKDEDRDVRKCTFRALRDILKQQEAHTWESLCQAIPHLFEKSDRSKRKAVLKALRGLFKDQRPEEWESCQPQLASLLGNENAHVKEAAKQLINQHTHITHKTSHKILKAIKEDRSLDTLRLPRAVKIEQLEELKLNYQKKKSEIAQQNNNEETPANLPFYLLLEGKYPSFFWKKSGKNVHLTFPDAPHWQPSLLSLLLADIERIPYMSLHKCFSIFPQLPASLVSNFSKLLKEIDALYPDVSSMADILKWIEAGLQGKPLILFSPVCPDYSVVKEESGLYRYTFNELGSGVGLLAKRLLAILPILDKFFEQYGLPVKIKVALGDFEALSESNLQRLHLTTDVFLSRLSKSKVAIQQSTSVPIEVMMITDLCEGLGAWNTYYLKYKKLLTQNEYGLSKLDNEKLIEIIKKRKPLYDRWQGERERLEDYLPQLLGQGAEYAAMGAIIAERYPHCLILGVDQPVMRPFYNVHQPLPILYLKPCYL